MPNINAKYIFLDDSPLFFLSPSLMARTFSPLLVGIDIVVTFHGIRCCNGRFPARPRERSARWVRMKGANTEGPRGGDDDQNRRERGAAG